MPSSSRTRLISKLSCVQPLLSPKNSPHAVCVLGQRGFTCPPTTAPQALTGPHGHGELFESLSAPIPLDIHSSRRAVWHSLLPCIHLLGFPGGLEVKNLPANAGDVGSIPESGRSPGEGNDNPLQYSCLGNSMDRGAWQVTVYGVAESWTQLSD